VQRRGCPWRLIPHDVPTWRTVCLSVREGTQAGVWGQVHAATRRPRQRWARPGPTRGPSRPSRASPPAPCVVMRVGPMEKKPSRVENDTGSETCWDDGSWRTCWPLTSAIAKEARGFCDLVREQSLRLQVIWVETGSDGAPFEHRVTACLNVCLEVVIHPWIGSRAVWVTAGEDVDWDRSSSSSSVSSRRRIGSMRATICGTRATMSSWGYRSACDLLRALSSVRARMIPLFLPACTPTGFPPEEVASLALRHGSLCTRNEYWQGRSYRPLR
jgi:hypothetical protein